MWMGSGFIGPHGGSQMFLSVTWLPIDSGDGFKLRLSPLESAFLLVVECFYL